MRQSLFDQPPSSETPASNCIRFQYRQVREECAELISQSGCEMACQGGYQEAGRNTFIACKINALPEISACEEILVGDFRGGRFDPISVVQTKDLSVTFNCGTAYQTQPEHTILALPIAELGIGAKYGRIRPLSQPAHPNTLQDTKSVAVTFGGFMMGMFRIAPEPKRLEIDARA